MAQFAQEGQQEEARPKIPPSDEVDPSGSKAQLSARRLEMGPKDALRAEEELTVHREDQ